MTREDMKLVEALKYCCDTNTECGVTHIPSSLLLKAIDMAIKELDRQEADGCEGCTFISVEEWELPCVRCKRGCKDYWRAKHGAKSEKTEEESDTQTHQDTF